MSILPTLQSEIVAAMKSGDAERRDSLRFILNSLKNEEKNKMSLLSDDEEIAILVKEAKKRREAIADIQKAAVVREDRLKREQLDLSIIESFLPKPLSEEEVENMVKDIIRENQFSGIKDLGKVMKMIMPKVRGLFPGDRLQSIIKQNLAQG